MIRHLSRTGILLACALGLAAPALAAPPTTYDISLTLGHGQTIAGTCEALEGGNLAETYRDGGCEDRTLERNGLTRKSAKRLPPQGAIVFVPSKEGYEAFTRRFAEPSAPAPAPREIVREIRVPVTAEVMPGWAWGSLAAFGVASVALLLLLLRSESKRTQAHRIRARRPFVAPEGSRPRASASFSEAIAHEGRRLDRLAAELDRLLLQPLPNGRRMDELVRELLSAGRITPLPYAFAVLAAECVPDAKARSERKISIAFARFDRPGKMSAYFHRLPWERAWQRGYDQKAVEEKISHRSKLAARTLRVREVRFREEPGREHENFDLPPPPSPEIVPQRDAEHLARRAPAFH